MSITDLLTHNSPKGQQKPCCFARAVVTQNDSSEFPGMVKVQYTLWEEEKAISKWIPCLFAYAGQEYGAYMLPEIDDIVIIGFLDNKQESPFVMGCLYPTGAEVPKEQFTEENYNRYIKTKGGLEITLDDEDGKQSIKVETPKGLQLCMDDTNPSIIISDEDKKNCITLAIDSGNIEIIADNQITLRAGGAVLKLSASSESISLNGAQITLESSRSLSVTSNNMLKVEGGIATVEGRQTLTLSGGMVRIT